MKKLLAFTMAEILLSLTIIGVVAAITLPSLTGNINERTWNTQRKALYARMSQAIALMPALNGFGTFKAPSGTEGTDSYNAGEDNVTETFITSGLSKVLKINNICDSTHLGDCGVPSKIIPLSGEPITTPTKITELNSYLITNPYGTNLMVDTKAAAFETQNGESILTFYNPNCVYYMNEYDTTTPQAHFFLQPKVCINFIYDMNGTKGPNTVGKDIGFMTVLYPSDNIIAAPNPAPQKASTATNQENAIQICKEQDAEYRIPTLEELSSMFVNQKLLIGTLYIGNTDYWSAKVGTSTYGWSQGFTSGAHWLHSKSNEYNVHCVKR